MTICGWLDRMMSRDLPVSARICCLRFSEASASRKTCSSSQHVVKVCQSVETKLISPVTNMFSTFNSPWFLFKKESRSTSWVAVQPKGLLIDAQYIQYTITGFLVWMRVRTQSLKSDAISQEGFVWVTAMREPPCFNFPFSPGLSFLYIEELGRNRAGLLICSVSHVSVRQMIARFLVGTELEKFILLCWSSNLRTL